MTANVLGERSIVRDIGLSWVGDRFEWGHLTTEADTDGRFAEYAGDIIRPGQQVVLLGDAGRGTEAKIRLARIGFDDVDCYWKWLEMGLLVGIKPKSQ